MEKDEFENEQREKELEHVRAISVCTRNGFREDCEKYSNKKQVN